MLNQKNTNLKVFLATLFIVVGIHNLNLNLNLEASNHDTFSRLHISNKAIATPTVNSPKDSLQEQALIAKKSGGRSGGGSFKRSSGSSRSSSPKSTKRSSSSSGSTRGSSSSYDSSPTYRDTYRHTPTRTYTHTRSSNSSALPWFVTLIIVSLVLLLIFAAIFLPLYLIFKIVSRLLNRHNASDSDRTLQTINRERDNDKVTVSQLQIALSPQASGLQQELSTLSLDVDTNTSEGLVELMRESVLSLLRHDRAWTYVLANSTSLDISQAETAFDKISLTERSKFSGESLSNVNGKIKTTETVTYNEEDFPAYIVVTLIFGTADDRPLFAKINHEQQLKETLLKLAAMREDYLLKFELLWTPQVENQYLTEEELLLEYTDMIKLV